MKLIYLSRWLPYPASNGSKLRIYNLLKRLAARGHDIHLITFYQPGEDPQAAADHLGQFCSAVEWVEYRPFERNGWRERLGFLRPRPRSVSATFVPQVARLVEAALKEKQPDLLVASQIDMAEYGKAAEKYGVPNVLEELEIAAVYEYFRRVRNPKLWVRRGLTWLKLATYTRHLAKHYRLITVVSEDEQKLVGTLSGETALHVISNGADLEQYHFHPYRAAERAERMVFNGALTFDQNYNAARFFLSEIFPLVRQAAPDLEVLITGRYDGVDLAGLRPDGGGLPAGVTLSGFVQDLRPLVAGSAICIAPIVDSGGTRLKILEAFALGTPVVTTTMGAEGLGAQYGEHILTADTPRDFAEAILRLRRDPELAARMTEKARRLVEARFDWEPIAARLDELLHQAAGLPLASDRVQTAGTPK